MKGKSAAKVVAVAALVVALALLGFRLFVVEPAPAPALPAPVALPEPAAPEPEVAAPEAVVVAVEGQVEQAGAGGTWHSVVRGDKVEVGGALRTGAASSAQLQVGEGTRLTAGAETELVVRAVTGAQQRFQLQRGRVTAAIDASGERSVRIENEAGAVVETAAARFAVMSSGQVLAVATETGGVTLTAAGTQVKVAPGEVALSAGGAAPVRAGPLPRELILKLARAKTVGGGLCAVVEGVAPPGAEVRVDGEALAVDATGHFRQVVPKREGRTGVRVFTRDLAGRTREERVACATEREPEVSSVKVNWAPTP